MPKRVSDKQKEKISESFIKGLGIKDISNIYNFSQQTIIKQLKIILGEEKFKTIKNKKVKDQESIKITNNSKENKKIQKDKILLDNDVVINENNNFEDKIIHETFFEIPPIATEINNDNQKDLSSKSLLEAKLPNVVYLLVDKNIELETKLLKDYPEWSFLSEDDLKRKTIQIFSEQKFAKRLCSNNQKLIKVPNSNVFLIASDILKTKGISRIIFEGSLLAL